MPTTDIQPTLHFRLVRRFVQTTFYGTFPTAPVLQQGWASSYGGPIEWRDVPTVDEPAPTSAGG